MNLFKALGEIIQSATDAIVTIFGAVNTSAEALEDVAHMAKQTTQSMREVIAEENSQALAELIAQRKIIEE